MYRQCRHAMYGNTKTNLKISKMLNFKTLWQCTIYVWVCSRPTRLLLAQKDIVNVPNQKVAKCPKCFLSFFFFFSWASSKLRASFTMVFTWNSSILHLQAVGQPITFSKLSSNLTRQCKDALKYGFIWDAILLLVHRHTKWSRDNPYSLHCRAND